MISNKIAIKGGTCSWKGQMEKTRSWKVRHEIEKNEVGKYASKLESSDSSWKVRAEVGKINTILKVKLTSERRCEFLTSRGESGRSFDGK